MPDLPPPDLHYQPRSRGAMQLGYSFNTIEPCWFPGDLPFPEMRTERVNVQLTGRAATNFPPYFEIGDLLCYRRPTPPESAITLMLTYHHSNVPLSTTPEPWGEWHPVPGSPIYGLIRVALPPEAVAKICKVLNENYSYELTLNDLEMIDVTGTASPKSD